jgi:hypothetical protein
MVRVVFMGVLRIFVAWCMSYYKDRAAGGMWIVVVISKSFWRVGKDRAFGRLSCALVFLHKMGNIMHNCGLHKDVCIPWALRTCRPRMDILPVLGQEFREEK